MSVCLRDEYITQRRLSVGKADKERLVSCSWVRGGGSKHLAGRFYCFVLFSLFWRPFRHQLKPCMVSVSVIFHSCLFCFLQIQHFHCVIVLSSFPRLFGTSPPPRSPMRDMCDRDLKQEGKGGRLAARISKATGEVGGYE